MSLLLIYAKKIYLKKIALKNIIKRINMEKTYNSNFESLCIEEFFLTFLAVITIMLSFLSIP
jgi:hypothetical protein